MDSFERKIDFLIKEYEKLKDEQHKRIEFRDQLTFVTLGAIGGVFSFAIEKPDYITALLVLPFVCIVLGWTYLINDEKVSEIGKFCREIVIPKIEGLQSENKFSILPSWEDFHRSVDRREERKIIQLVIDLCIFCLSSIFSIGAFFILSGSHTKIQIVVGALELLVTLYLGYQFFSYSSLQEGE